MKKLTWLLALMLSVAVFADTIKSIAPNNGEVVSPLAPSMKLFLMMSEDAARAALKDAGLASRLCNDIRSFAPGIPMQWAFSGERGKIHYELHVAENSHFRNEKVIQAPHSHSPQWHAWITKVILLWPFFSTTFWRKPTDFRSPSASPEEPQCVFLHRSANQL